MKLFVTIPAYNEDKTLASVIKEIPRSLPGVDEIKVLVLNDGSSDNTARIAKEAGADFVISHKKNKGLAVTFGDAIEEALKQGADIVVNTDADNHYDQSKIFDLISPILNQEADIVVGGRKIENLETMPFINRLGNRIGSFVTYKLGGLPKLDVSSGFRAYSREAALKLYVFSDHTYTHSTLLNAADHKLIIKEVPIKARKVTRKSRLIPSIPHFIVNAGVVIVRNIILFKPLRVFSVIGLVVFIPGLILVIRFLYYYASGSGQGHVQSLIIASVLMMIGFQIFIMGLIASAIGWNRKLLEEILFRVKKREFSIEKDNKDQLTL